MKTALEILRTFRRMGAPPAEQPEFWRPQCASRKTIRAMCSLIDRIEAKRCSA